MADLLTDLRTHLLGVTAIANEIGTKMRRGHAAQNDTSPFVVYNLINRETAQSINTGKTGRGVSQIDFVVHGGTYLESRTVADLIRGELEDMHQTTMGSTLVGAVQFLSEQEDLDAPTENSEDYVYLVTQDYRFFHNGV